MNFEVGVEYGEHFGPSRVVDGRLTKVLERLEQRLHDGKPLIFVELATGVVLDEYVDELGGRDLDLPVLTGLVDWNVEEAR